MTMIGGGGVMLLRRQFVMTAHKSGTVAWQLVTVMPGSLARQAQSRTNWAFAAVMARKAARRATNFIFIMDRCRTAPLCVWNRAVLVPSEPKSEKRIAESSTIFALAWSGEICPTGGQSIPTANRARADRAQVSAS